MKVSSGNHIQFLQLLIRQLALTVHRTEFHSPGADEDRHILPKNNCLEKFLGTDFISVQCLGDLVR